mmetsp:Transcript_106721/g.311989  ORF Transcript_106721/g.311989 Transcript_106721/m.311989 type:complete len:294 (-) Transcript_106721:426-1307(-)
MACDAEAAADVHHGWLAATSILWPERFLATGWTQGLQHGLRGAHWALLLLERCSPRHSQAEPHFRAALLNGPVSHAAGARGGRGGGGAELRVHRLHPRLLGRLHVLPPDQRPGGVLRGRAGPRAGRPAGRRAAVRLRRPAAAPLPRPGHAAALRRPRPVLAQVHGVLPAPPGARAGAVQPPRAVRLRQPRRAAQVQQGLRRAPGHGPAGRRGGRPAADGRERRGGQAHGAGARGAAADHGALRAHARRRRQRGHGRPLQRLARADPGRRRRALRRGASAADHVDHPRQAVDEV